MTTSVSVETLAQTRGGDTPYLNVSEHMGTIIGVCIVLIVVVFIAQRFKKKSK